MTEWTKIIEDLKQIVGAHRSGRRRAVATVRLMLGPTSRELEQRAEEARVVAEQMHNPGTKRTMINLALSYERLARHAALREASEAAEQNAPPEQGRNEAACSQSCKKYFLAEVVRVTTADV